MQRHRATTSTGAVVDDPKPAELARLVVEVARAGRGAFLFLERHADRTGQTFVQALRHAGAWTLEVRAGTADRHFRVSVTDDAAVTAALVSWQAGTADWTQLPWQQVPREAWADRESRHLASAR